MPEVAEILQTLEERLLQPSVRSDQAMLGVLLLPEFCEFGSSGRVFDRAAILALLAEEREQQASENHADSRVEAFTCEVLAPGVALVTYRIARAAAGSLRSSVWVERDGRWQMRFHQGTRLPGAAG